MTSLEARLLVHLGKPITILKRVKINLNRHQPQWRARLNADNVPWLLDHRMGKLATLSL